jgi:Ca2+-binding EF-hand superfamily protein
MEKLKEACICFDRDQAGANKLLQDLENREIDKEYFFYILRMRFDCRLSIEEQRALIPLLDNKGFIDGTEFIMLFYRFRYDHRNAFLRSRVDKEKKFKEDEKKRHHEREKEFERKLETKLNANFSEEDLESAMEKLIDASIRFERLFLGTPQLLAFECEAMRPAMFRQQLQMIFGINLTSKEYGALVSFLAREEDGQIPCINFLMMFFKLGFKEKSDRLAKRRILAKKIEEAEKARLKANEDGNKEKWVEVTDPKFDASDLQRAIAKLREAARVHSTTSLASTSMKAFEVSKMPPHVFKDLLKRLLQLELTPKELGALIEHYDDNHDGFVSCAEFSKHFMMMNFEEKDKERERMRKLQKAAEEAKKEAEAEKQRKIAEKNSKKFTFEYTPEEYESAMKKLIESAWRYDSTSPGSFDLEDAFKMKYLAPHELKEQIKTTMSISVLPGELGALLTFFEADESGLTHCKKVVAKYLAAGVEERNRRKKAWREHDMLMQAKRIAEEKKKLELAEKKMLIDLADYGEADFDSAFAKLSEASLHYSKEKSGGLGSFDPECMPPHVFKEQCKLVFNVKLTNRELASLVAHYDKSQTGMITCKDFLYEFFRLGNDERERIRERWRVGQKLQLERELKEEAEKKKAELERAMKEADFEFTEEDFDAALWKFISMCHDFDYRQLGPAGFKGFQGTSLTPGEFKEMARRTFNLKLNSREIGALSIYLNPAAPQTINCSTFVYTFVKLRVQCETFKGKKGEMRLMREYHEELKEAYKIAIASQNDMKSYDKLRPWRAARQTLLRGQKEVKHKETPKTAEQKLKLLLRLGKASGRLDLSTRSLQFSLSDEVKLQGSLDSGTGREDEERNDGILELKDVAAKDDEAVEEVKNSDVEHDEGDGRKAAAEVSGPGEVKGAGLVDDSQDAKQTEQQEMRVQSAAADAAAKNSGAEQSSEEIELLRKVKDGEVVDPKTIEHFTKDKKNKHSLIAGGRVNSIDFCLTSIPEIVFKMTHLTELWLSNNKLSFIPPNIRQINGLRILCLSGNLLEAIPEEIGDLGELQQLYLGKNKLKNLPETLCKLISLVELNLHGNCFHNLPPVVCHMQALQVLDISNNSIASLPDTMFKLKSLVYLNITENSSIQAPPAPPVLRKMRWCKVHGIMTESLLHVIGGDFYRKFSSHQIISVPEKPDKVLRSRTGSSAHDMEGYTPIVTERPGTAESDAQGCTPARAQMQSSSILSSSALGEGDNGKPTAQSPRAASVSEKSPRNLAGSSVARIILNKSIDNASPRTNFSPRSERNILKHRRSFEKAPQDVSTFKLKEPGEDDMDLFLRKRAKTSAAAKLKRMKSLKRRAGSVTVMK